MLRQVTTLLMFFATGLYAWQPQLPLSLQVDAQDQSGFSSELAVSVKVALRSDVVKDDIGAGDVQLQIYLPPAMELVQGDLEWKGFLAPGESKTIKLVVKPTLQEPLLWDIGAAVTSSLLKRVMFDEMSVYLGENRGVVIRDIHQQVEKDPWLKTALGFREITIVENGIEKTILAPFAGKL